MAKKIEGEICNNSPFSSFPSPSCLISCLFSTRDNNTARRAVANGVTLEHVWCFFINSTLLNSMVKSKMRSTVWFSSNLRSYQARSAKIGDFWEFFCTVVVLKPCPTIHSQNPLGLNKSCGTLRSLYELIHIVDLLSDNLTINSFWGEILGRKIEYNIYLKKHLRKMAHS